MADDRTAYPLQYSDTQWADLGYGPGGGGITIDVVNSLIATYLSTWTAPALARPVVTTSAAGAMVIDRSAGMAYAVTLTGNVTSVTVENWGASGNISQVFLDIVSAGFSIAWNLSVIWEGGIKPALVGKSLVILTTVDGGATIFGNVVGQNYSAPSEY